MHILIFAAFYNPHRGGYELYIEEIAKRLVQRGERVTVVTCNTERVAAVEIVDGVHILRLPCWNMLGGTYPVPKLSGSVMALWKYVRSEGVTTINTQTRFFMTSVLGWLLAKTTGRPLLHTEHGTRHVVLPARIPRLISFLFDHTLGWLVTHTATVVMSGSASAGSFAQHLGAKKFVIVYNGVDTTYFHPISRDNQAAAKRVLFVGRLIAAKGVQDLISAFTGESSAVPGAHLTIVGRGNYQDQLQALVEDAKNITILGEISRDDLRDQYQQADIFVNPSYSEGLPTSVLEALACGCRVIATDVGGTSEIATTLKTTPDQLRLYQPHDVAALREQLRVFLTTTTPVSPVEMTAFAWEECARRFAAVAESALPHIASHVT